MKLCVFPNDPIIAYYNKGEIKERYYNPKKVFDKIDIISFTEEDIEEAKVRSLVGDADLKIHCVGKINFVNKSSKKNKILKLVKSLQPNVIRAYNPLLQGWMAAYCSEKMKIPFFLSLHVQYDGLRKIIKTKNYKKYLALKYSRKIVEPYTLSQADKITAVYKIIDPYVFELSGRHPEILYNRVDLKRFDKGVKIQDYDKPLILSVGRLTPQKNHDLLINAVKNLDVFLMIIGGGELLQTLTNLVEKLSLQDRVLFKESVPNEQIQDYYKTADVFALAYNPEVEGLPIPVLEAMASGLPTIVPNPIEGFSDGLEDAVIYANMNSESFASEIKKIIEDVKYAREFRGKAHKRAIEFDGEKTEQREADMYKELLSSKKLS